MGRNIEYSGRKTRKEKNTGDNGFLITKLWEAIHSIWRFWNGAQHGVTKEERKRRTNEKIHPRIRAANRTQHQDVLYFSQRFFGVELNRRLEMKPIENE